MRERHGHIMRIAFFKTLSDEFLSSETGKKNFSGDLGLYLSKGKKIVYNISLLKKKLTYVSPELGLNRIENMKLYVQKI